MNHIFSVYKSNASYNQLFQTSVFIYLILIYSLNYTIKLANAGIFFPDSSSYYIEYGTIMAINPRITIPDRPVKTQEIASNLRHRNPVENKNGLFYGSHNVSVQQASKHKVGCQTSTSNKLSTTRHCGATCHSVF